MMNKEIKAGCFWMALWLIGVTFHPACLSLAATLDTHTVALDGEGKLIPWTADPGQGYDRVMYLSWDLLKNRMPNNPANGLPVTYTHSEYDPGSLTGSSWPNNAASKAAMLADSAVLYYAYSGDYGVITLVRGLLDHHLQHGTTPTNHVWARVPWSTAAAGSITFGNDSMVEGVGVLEPDKVGELGYHGYLRFYQLTGETNYLAAALACADALALHVRIGNATQSPWPFRVVAQTGAVRDDYCSHVIAPIRLFDELIRLGLGDTNAYQSARQKAWNWLLTYPMSNRAWAAYFEDMSGYIGNLNQYGPGQTARYLLERPELDPNWYDHVTNLLGFIESTFGGTDMGEPGLQYGARVISEQTDYKYKMASHTSRFGAANALLYSLTGDLAVKDKAYRSLNWSTYMCRNNGVVIEGPYENANRGYCWFSDGHGDYIRHFMLAIGAVPEWAPAGQNHIVRSTSVIKSVVYTTNSVTYTTFDSASTETLRLGFTPGVVLVDGVALNPRADVAEPGWVFDPSTAVLRIRHDVGTQVQVLAGVPPPSIVTSFLPTGVIQQPYLAALTASGGVPPYAWSLESGVLPAGLTLNATGNLGGTPTVAGTFSFTIQASDASDPVQTASKALSLQILGTLQSIAVTPANASVPVGGTQPYAATGTYSDGSVQDLTGQVTWASSHPEVATINANGVATAIAPGTTTISAALNGMVEGVSLTVESPPSLTIATYFLKDGLVRIPYSASLSAVAGVPPYTWSLVSGSLPPGLALNSGSGVLSGTPGSPGAFSFTVRVVDAGAVSQSVTRPMTLTINATGTFGNTVDGSQTDALWNNGAWINAARFQCASNMTVSSVQAKVVGIAGRYKCAIYTDASSLPSRLLGRTTEVVGPALGWHVFPLINPVALTNGQFYWLAVWSDDAAARAYHSGSSGTLRWGRYDFGEWPDPLSTSSGGNFNYSIYASGHSTPVLGLITLVPPAPTITYGDSLQMAATGYYTDGSVSNLTTSAAWQTLSSSVAAVGSSGLVTGNSSGSTTISAEVGEVTGTTPIIIDARPLSVVANDASRVYGEANPVFSGVINGLVVGDGISATYTTTATSESPVGDYDIVPELMDPQNRLENYTVTLVNGVLKIFAPPQLLDVFESPQGTLVVVWQVVAGRTYRFQYKESLTDAVWTPLRDDFVADSTSVVLIESMGARLQGFYRLLDVTPP